MLDSGPASAAGKTRKQRRRVCWQAHWSPESGGPSERWKEAPFELEFKASRRDEDAIAMERAHIESRVMSVKQTKTDQRLCSPISRKRRWGSRSVPIDVNCHCGL